MLVVDDIIRDGVRLTIESGLSDKSFASLSYGIRFIEKMILDFVDEGNYDEAEFLQSSLDEFKIAMN